jgi:hypothetical protein
MAKRHLWRIVAVSWLLVLVAGACGDDGAADAASTDEAGGDDPTTTTEGEGGDDAGTTTTQDTSATTTTEPVSDGPAPLAPEDIPDLVRAWGDGTGDPLELAQAVIHFPLEVPVPDGTTPLHVSADLIAVDGGPWQWEWTYEVLSDEPIPEIDIHLEEASPGEVALREFYDPIMAELGWSYSNTTGSDPSSGGGGPQTVNHVYQSDTDSLVVNGLPATPDPLFVWADEEQVFGEGVPGYQVDAQFEFEVGAVPVPLIAAVLAEVPEVEGAELIDARLLSWNRPESSFDAEWGLRYLEVSLEWRLPTGTADAATAMLRSGLDDSAFFPGEESFFDEGVLETVEPRIFDDDWTQPIVFLDRYRGSVRINRDDADPTMAVDVMLEPNRTELQRPAP